MYIEREIPVGQPTQPFVCTNLSSESKGLTTFLHRVKQHLVFLALKSREDVNNLVPVISGYKVGG